MLPNNSVAKPYLKKWQDLFSIISTSPCFWSWLQCPPCLCCLQMLLCWLQQQHWAWDNKSGSTWLNVPVSLHCHPKYSQDCDTGAHEPTSGWPAWPDSLCTVGLRSVPGFVICRATARQVLQELTHFRWLIGHGTLFSVYLNGEQIKINQNWIFSWW